jgi:hypothetical protein
MKSNINRTCLPIILTTQCANVNCQSTVYRICIINIECFLNFADEDLRRYRGGGPGPAAGGPGQGQGRGDERNEKLSRLLKTMVNSGWFHGYGVVMDDLQQKTLMRADPDSDDQRRSRQRQAWETDVENTWRTMRDKRRG